MGVRAASCLLIAAALSGSLIALAAPTATLSGAAQTTVPSAAQAPRSAKAQSVAVRLAPPPAPLPGFDPLAHRAQGTQLVSDLPDGRVAELTLDPGLQAHVSSLLRQYEVPYGAVVAIEPNSGKVLAYVSHSSANPDAGDLARDPSPPAASVFKVITAAALVDAGVSPEARVCYGGGMQRLVNADLVDDPKRDRHCASLAQALGDSINTIFAKLADRTLAPKVVERYAQAFGFGHALPFDVATRVSPAEVPLDRLELARTAAGFWHTHMSPLHGALIAATIANDGVMPRPLLVNRVLDAGGNPLFASSPSAYRNVISRTTARAVGHMMTETVTRGTSRSAFYDPRGRPFLPGISVAGKTGSLSSGQPYRAYSWWVGFAPEDKPRIALAALIVNTPKWRIKASFVAREALRYQLVARKPAVESASR
jgi:cell division protein FtsI/penicillin-binding protein 2